jgi:hypothetical protein
MEMPLHNVFTLVFRGLPVSEVCDTTYENVTLDAATRRHHRRRVRCVRRPIKKRHATGQERQPASTMADGLRLTSLLPRIRESYARGLFATPFRDDYHVLGIRALMSLYSPFATLRRP